jgi:hypothetical protein
MLKLLTRGEPRSSHNPDGHLLGRKIILGHLNNFMTRTQKSGTEFISIGARVALLQGIAP